MITLPDSDTNKAKLARLSAAWQELLVTALRRGFYGTATIEVAITDGTIQSIRKKVERVEV
jgi:hypothetical protein